MAEITSYSYRIEPQDVDFTLRASASSVINYLLNVAGIDAHNKGFGVDVLQGQSFTWVLSRLAVEINRQPHQYDNVDIETWVNEFNRLSSTRNFRMTYGGEVLASGVSQWCMLDFSTRMPADMNAMAKAHEGNMVDAPSPCERPRRLAALDGEPVLQHRVTYSDIDFNRHMNTMRYIDIVFDTMPIEMLEKLDKLRMDINFMREARYGDELSLLCEERDNMRLCEFRNDAGDVLCRASLEER